MNIKLFKDLLAVPTRSGAETKMVKWLKDYVRAHIPGATITSDVFNNVYVVKGSSPYMPCVAAHLDTVQSLDEIQIIQSGHRLYGAKSNGELTGCGADDKAGIFVCLNLLRSVKNIKAVFFASEEVGCVGAYRAHASFFSDIGYVIEYDCPSRNMVSYTCGGVRLFANGSDFITAAAPVLVEHGSVLWQHHPFTDVMAIRKRFTVPCLNLSCGYYNWHARNEFISLPETDMAITQGRALLRELGCRSFMCSSQDCADDTCAPLIEVGYLRVPTPVC